MVFMAGLLSACGSGGSSSGAAVTTITGSVVAAPVAGAALTVKDSNGNTLAGPVTTAADGSYSINVPASALQGLLVFESTGGQYTDEASGASTNAGSLTAMLEASSMGTAVHLTPASTIVHQLVAQHGLSLSEAKARFKNAFGFDIDTAIRPEDAAAPSADAGKTEKLAGLRAAAFSQLTADLGLNAEEQFALLGALAEDLADGDLDGTGIAGAVAVNSMTMPEDIQSRFTRAMMSFHEKGTDGLDSDQIGVPVFAKVAMSASYRVEYIPGAMKAMEGKTMFTLRISDGSGAAVSGLTPKLMPKMHMASGMKHSAPTTGCTENAQTAGDYNCTVYYLMPSTMAGGMSMGYWELKVMPDMSESVTFYPQVMMAMGDTPKVKVKGQTDVIKDMMGMDEKRNYYIFKDGLRGTGPYTLTLFIAAKETMMDFPAVIVGNTLQSGMGGTPLLVSSVNVAVTANGTPVGNATDNTDGTWSIDLNLNSGVANTVEVELSVNGERKTSDGTDTGLNGKFTITPGGM
ncbi:MAG TPA: hypothetical protein ENJ11_02515 [Gammaproteobacteria bacterium]|nr:hypothetical protein [Gammaproteobacteria bacterium]